MTETIQSIHQSEVREQLFTQLYEDTYPKVAKFVANRGGTFQDAKDIFQDALVILYEKLAHQDLVVDSSVDFYLIGIAKHLWVRKFRHEQLQVELTATEKAISIPPDYFELTESRLSNLLRIAGKKCMNILQAFYYDNAPLEEIRSAFGFSTLHSASVQKFKCIEKMRNIVQQKSMDYEDFA